MSAAGIAFWTDGDSAELPPGTCLDGVTVRIGACVLRGEAVVRNVRDAEPGRIEVGCVFYPDPREEDRWMTLLAGIDAAAHFEGDLG
jgi:hypothetical protein